MNIFRQPLRIIDAWLNRFTMYAIVLYGLRALFVVALLLAVTEVISVNPAGLIVSALTLATACLGANIAFSKFFTVPYNKESWTITALILCFIITPRTSLEFILLAALTGVLAIASKFIITWHGSHFLNPVAAGAVIVSVTGLLGVTWWVATPWLAPFAALLALVVLRKQRKFGLFFSFAIAAIATMLIVNLLSQSPLPASEILRVAVLSWPIIFLGSIMLTEPITLPVGRYYQVLMAIIVGLVFGSQQHLGPITSSPHVALIIGNLFAVMVSPPFSAMLTLKSRRQLADDILELTFAKPKHLVFRAGQYMEWTLSHAPTDARGNRRTFSMASAPEEPDISIAIRTYPKGSSYKKVLSALQPGDRLRAANIDGEFVLPLGTGPVAMIAGGIGITPFRAHIAQLVKRKQQRDIVLVYLASNKEHFVFKALFKQAAIFGLKVEYVVGRLDGPEIINLVPDIATRQVLISGPDAMVSDYKQALIQAGVAGKQIKTDHFSGY